MATFLESGEFFATHFDRTIVVASSERLRYNGEFIDTNGWRLQTWAARDGSLVARAKTIISGWRFYGGDTAAIAAVVELAN